MLDNVEVFCQSSIKISKDKIIYFDPFKISNKYSDADIIFITHDHYDHYDKDSILNIKNDFSYIVIPNSLLDQVSSYFDKDKILVVEPNKEYSFAGITFKTIPAYNLNKKFHPKDNNWVGYIVNINGTSYYAMGDTDVTFEAKEVCCDVIFVPIGGTYTMDYKEAAEYINFVKPNMVVPIHYGSVVGDMSLGEDFKNLLDSSIICKILIK